MPLSQIIPPSPSLSSHTWHKIRSRLLNFFGNDDPVCESKRGTDCRVDFWTLRERERVGCFGRMALKHVYYHVRIESPVYVQCRIQHAWGWCTGMIQRDVMGREVGGGFMFGNACTPVVDSCRCMAKPIQYCKVK